MKKTDISLQNSPQRTIEGADWRGHLVATSRVGDEITVLVELPDGGHCLLPASSLERTDDGLRSSLDQATLEAFRLQKAIPEHLVLPVVAEEIEVSKRVVEGDTFVVRTATHVDEQPIEVDLERQIVDVERVAVDRFVDEAPRVREDDGVTIVPVVEEVLVVSKRLKLREEIHIRRRSVVETERSSVTLRRQEAHVERRSADGPEPQ